MRAVFYGRVGNFGFKPISEVLSGLGYCIEWRDRANTELVENADIVFSAGLGNPMGEVYSGYTAKAVPVIVTDAAFIRLPDYFQMGFGLNWLPSWDCEEDRFLSLGIELKERSQGECIVIAGQKPDDAQHRISEDKLTELYQGWVDEIKNHTDRPIIFRPHPRRPTMRLEGVSHDVPTDKKRGGLDQLLLNAHCLIAYNSTACTDALIAGVPFYSHSSQAQALSNGLDFSSIETPWFPDDHARLAHLNRVAHAQWKESEISDNVLRRYLYAAQCWRGAQKVNF